MKLVHVIRRVHAVRRAKGAEHLQRQLEVDNIDHLVAVEAKLPPGHTHHDGVPFAVIAVTEHGGFEIFVEGIIGGGVVGGETVIEEGLFGHISASFFLIAKYYKSESYRNF